MGTRKFLRSKGDRKMNKKVLITGGGGLLGSNIAKMAVENYDVYATYNKNKVSFKGVRFIKLDLAEKNYFSEIKELNPHFIIHCAALTNVDYCENNQAEAYRNNVLASSNIAEIARQLNAYLIHISTDSVFDGYEGNYTENDRVNPINVYGKTKLEAENEIARIQPHSCIIRTSIYGWNKRNKKSLAEWMLNELIQKKEVPAFKDIYFSPILVNDLASLIFRLIEKKYEGVLHVSGGQSCSKQEFAYKIAEVFNCDCGYIRSISVQDSVLKAQRGRDISLDVSKAERLLGVKFPDVIEGLQKMKQLRENGFLKELKDE